MTAVHVIILGGICLPFLMTWVFWKPFFLLKIDRTVQTLGILSFAFYFVSIPVRILWDVVLGCHVVTRIQELRLEVRRVEK